MIGDIMTQLDIDPFAELPVEAEPEPMPPEQFIAMVTASGNLAVELADAELAKIAQQVLDDYKIDEDSMADWFTRMDRGIKLAKLDKDAKTYPFTKAANIKYPLVTSAALQFNARAYPAIVPSGDLVKAQISGKDPQGIKAARGERIAGHMSYQLVNQIEEWEEDTDKLLLQLPIVGTMVRKWWYDPVAGRPRCRLLEPGSFVINDKVRNLSDAPRCSHKLPLYPGEIETRIRSDQFAPFEYDEEEDKQELQEFIEQHCRLDLDEDGYAEPYIVTVHKETRTVVRIVADFEPDDVKYIRGQPGADMFGQPTPPAVEGIAAIQRGSYFIAYKFMPGIDGGFHGTGLGLLLGDISDTINTIINMMLDAGHMASLGGGFIGSEFRIKGGSQRFEPGEWKTPNAAGADMRQAIVPMTFPGPDAVLFQLLGMLIDAGREISSTKDIMTGDNGGKVQTATTTMALIEQGMMVFTAAYKRIYRALKGEYKLLAKINARNLSAEEYSAFHDEMGPDGQPVQFDPAQEYGAADMDITPTADPASVTKMQAMAKAEMLKQLAAEGMVDPKEATQRILDAAAISDTEKLLPPPPEPDPMIKQMEQFQMQMAMEMAKADLSQKLVNIDLTMAKIEAEKADTTKVMTEVQAAAFDQRMNQLMQMMMERRNAIEGLIAGGMGGLAGQPDHGGGQGGAGGYPPAAGPGGPVGVYGGPGMA